MDLLLFLTLGRDSIELAEPPMWVHILLQLTIYGLIFYLGYRVGLRKVTMPYFHVLKHLRICELLGRRDREKIDVDSDNLPPLMQTIGDFSKAFFTEHNSKQTISELEDHFVGKIISESTHNSMLEAIDGTFAEFEAEQNQSDNQQITGNNYGNNKKAGAEADNA